MTEKRFSRMTRIVAHIALAFLVVTTAGWAVHSNVPEGPFTGSVTVRTEIVLPTSPDAAGFEGAWLAGLSTKPGADPDLLAVALTKQQSGWFSVWGVQLYSAAGLLPAQRQSFVGSDMLHGGTFTDLSWDPNGAKWGHTLETWLSYDAKAGEVAVWVYDITEATIIYSGHYDANVPASEIYAAAGSRYGDATEPLAAMTAHPAYIPRGIQWDVHDIGDVAGQVDRSAPNASLQVHVPGTIDGTVQFRLRHSAGEHDLAVAQQLTGPQSFHIDLSLWPPGPAAVVMEAMHNGDVLFTEEKRVNVGYVTVQFEPQLQLVVTDSGQHALQGVVTVGSDDWLPPATLAMTYHARTPRQTVPLHDGWQEVRGETTIALDSVDSEPTRHTFHIPLAHLGTSAYEIFVDLQAALDVDVGLMHSNPYRFVVGERPRPFPAVKDYVVLRADLHVHTTRSHDGSVRPLNRVWETYAYGYDVLAITDHKNMLAYDEVKDFANDIGLTLLRGMETGLGRREEFTVLGLNKQYELRDEHEWAVNRNEHYVYYQDQVQTIIDHGGLFIYAHPGYPVIGGDHPEADAGWTEPIAWMVENGYLHGVEVRGYAGRNRDVPYQWALDHNLAIVDVTDIHEPRNFNQAFETPHALILAADTTPDAVLDAIRHGRTLAVSNGQLRGAEQWVSALVDAVLHMQLVEQNGEQCLMVVNTGSLTLQGTAQVTAGGPWRQLFLIPQGTVCVPWPSGAGELLVRFSNVWVGPNTLLQRTYTIAPDV